MESFNFIEVKKDLAIYSNPGQTCENIARCLKMVCEAALFLLLKGTRNFQSVKEESILKWSFAGKEKRKNASNEAFLGI